jgi:hypothetical protein
MSCNIPVYVYLLLGLAACRGHGLRESCVDVVQQR